MELFITLIKKILRYIWSQLHQMWTNQLLRCIEGKWTKDVKFFPFTTFFLLGMSRHIAHIQMSLKIYTQFNTL